MPRVTPDAIRRAAATAADVALSDLEDGAVTRRVVRARRAAMAVAYRCLDYTLREAADVFGAVSHSSAHLAVRRSDLDPAQRRIEIALEAALAPDAGE